METQQYQRKPIYVQAVRVTEDNFFDVAQWCQGAITSGTPGTKSLDELKKDKTKFIKVRVINPQRVRQTKAFVGDWVLYSEYNGYKVYTNGAFENAFMKPEDTRSVEQAVEELRAEQEKGPTPEERAAHEAQIAQLPENAANGTYGGAREVN